MKILFIVPSYKPAFIYGGPIRSIAALCESLVIAGHEVTVYTTRANGLEELNAIPGKCYPIEGVDVYYFSRNTKGHSNLSVGLLNHVNATCLQYDIVHIQSWWNLVALPSAHICLRKSIRPIISLRGSLTDYTFTHRRSIPKRIVHATIGKFLLKRAILHVTSEKERKEVIHYVPNGVVRTIPNLLEIPSGIVGSHEDRPYLNMVFLGRIDPAKNLEMLLRVLTQLDSVPFKLVIAGEGSPEYVSKLKTESIKIREITWIGNVEGEEKYKLLAESDVLVLPSHTENFGNVVIEALSQGTPVMLSSNVGTKDYVIQHNLGWVISGDEQDWRAGFEQLWKNKAERESIRLRAPMCISRDFNRKEQVKLYVDMYQQNLQRRGN